MAFGSLGVTDVMYAPHQYTLNIIAKPCMGIHLRLVLRICAIQLALRVQVPTSREFVHGLFASAGTPKSSPDMAFLE